jgi:peptidoglycan-N-acetylglucosamine deacetylase
MPLDAVKGFAERFAFRLTLLALSLGSACVRSEPSTGAPNGKTTPIVAASPREPEVLAWVLPYENSLASLERNARFLTIASPTFFRLAVSGKSARLEDWDPGAPFPRRRLGTALEGAAAAVLPLVGCIGPCGPLISRVLDDDAARKAHVDDLVRVAREQKLAGLVIDYEDVDARESSVSRFVDDLASALHAAGKRLVLVVQEPCGFDPACKRNPYPFALAKLVRAVDLLVIMEYDSVVDGSGPPAPRAWVELGLRKVIADVGERELHKVVCGVPLYGRVTQGMTEDTAVLFDDVRASGIGRTKATLGTRTLDPQALSKLVTVTTPTRSGTLYLEDRDTIAARIAHLSQLKLGGIALWRLGGEDRCVTPELAKLRGLPPPACR